MSSSSVSSTIGSLRHSTRIGMDISSESRQTKFKIKNHSRDSPANSRRSYLFRWVLLGRHILGGRFAFRFLASGVLVIAGFGWRSSRGSLRKRCERATFSVQRFGCCSRIRFVPRFRATLNVSKIQMLCKLIRIETMNVHVIHDISFIQLVAIVLSIAFRI